MSDNDEMADSRGKKRSAQATGRAPAAKKSTPEKAQYNDFPTIAYLVKAGAEFLLHAQPQKFAVELVSKEKLDELYPLRVTGWTEDGITPDGLLNIMFPVRGDEDGNQRISARDMILRIVNNETIMRMMDKGPSQDWGFKRAGRVLISWNGLKLIMSQVILSHALAKEAVNNEGVMRMHAMMDLLNAKQGLGPIVKSNPKAATNYFPEYEALGTVSIRLREFASAPYGSEDYETILAHLQDLQKYHPYIRKDLGDLLGQRDQARVVVNMAFQGNTLQEIRKYLDGKEPEEFLASMPNQLSDFRKARAQKTAQLEQQRQVQELRVTVQNVRKLPPTYTAMVDTVVLRIMKEDYAVKYGNGDQYNQATICEHRKIYDIAKNIFYGTAETDKLSAEEKDKATAIRDKIGPAMGEISRYYMKEGYIPETKVGEAMIRPHITGEKTPEELFMFLVACVANPANLSKKYERRDSLRKLKYDPIDVQDDTLTNFTQFLSNYDPDNETVQDAFQLEYTEIMENASFVFPTLYYHWLFYFKGLDVRDADKVQDLIKRAEPAAKSTRIFSSTPEFFITDVLCLMLVHVKHQHAKDRKAIREIMGIELPSFIRWTETDEEEDDSMGGRPDTEASHDEEVLEIPDDDKVDEAGNPIRYVVHQPTKDRAAVGDEDEDDDAGDDSATHTEEIPIHITYADVATSHIWGKFMADKRARVNIDETVFKTTKGKMVQYFQRFFKNVKSEQLVLSPEKLRALKPSKIDSMLVEFRNDFDEDLFVGEKTLFDGKVGYLVMDAEQNSVLKPFLTLALTKILIVKLMKSRARGYAEYKNKVIKDLETAHDQLKEEKAKMDAVKTLGGLDGSDENGGDANHDQDDDTEGQGGADDDEDEAEEEEGHAGN